MKRALFPVGICLAILLACDGDVVITARVRDLLDLGSGKAEIIHTTAGVMTTSISRDSEKDFIRSVIGTITNEGAAAGEHPDAFSFDTRVPILGMDVPESRVGEKDLLFIKVQESAGGHSMAYKFNPIVLERISNWVESEYQTAFDVGGFSMNLVIDNDSTEDFRFVAKSVYIDDVAYPFEVSITLGRGESVNLTVSEILGSSVEGTEGYVPFLSF